MPLTLVQLLAARGLAPGDLQAAEARRVKLGGGLETSLLELGVLPEPQVGDLWSEASRLPRPPHELVKDVTSGMASLFPQQLAERYGMVPLGLVRRQLSLLVKHPVDLSTVDEISFLLSRPLKLFVGTELEIAELLGLVYAVPIPQRFKDLRLMLGPSPSISSAAGTEESETRPAEVQGEQTFAPEAATVTPEGGTHQPPTAPAEVPPVVAPMEGAMTPIVATASVDPVQAPVESPPEAEAAPSEQAWPSAQPEVSASLETSTVPAPASASASAPVESAPLPLRRSLSPGEPWSLKFPLVEPPSAFTRGKAAPEPKVQAPPPPRPATWPESRPSAQPEPWSEPWSASPPEIRIVSSSASVSLPEPNGDTSASAPTAQPHSLSESVPEPVSPVSADSRGRVDPEIRLVPEPGSETLAVAVRVERPSPMPVPEPSPFEATPMSSGYGGRLAMEPRMSAAEAMAALREEQTRDGVIGVAVDFMRGAFDFVAVFVRHQDSFQVFEATGVDYGGGADLTQTIVDLDRSRVLRTVVEGKAPYVGPIPSWDPLEGALGALGRGRLRAVLMYPIVIRDRTIAVIHGDRGGEALAPRQLSDVALVLSQLGSQLERVIRERRQGPRPSRGSTPVSPASTPVSPAPLPSAPEAAEAPKRPQAAAAEPTPPPVEVPPPIPPATPPSQMAPFSLVPPDLGEELTPSGTSNVEVARSLTNEPFEVPIDWIEVSQEGGLAGQVRAFLSGDPPARAAAAVALRAGGTDAGWALADRFPGPLFVFRMTIDELPGPDAMGPLMGLMASLGPAAVPALADSSQSPNEERRFWSTMLLAKIGDHSAVPILAWRLLDSSPDVALAARRGLWRLRDAPEFAQVLEHATTELQGADAEKSIPILQALGQFHHVPAIPLLIGLLGARDQQVSQAAVEALREIARQDFSTSERRWNAWWEQAKGRPRLHWVIDALEDRDRDLRLAAISELTELTGFDLGYRSDLDPGRQAPALTRWREWLEREGRPRATPVPFPTSG